MEYVRTFTFENGLFGQNASSKDFIGIEFPDATVMGSKRNVKLRFTEKYMRMAAEGKIEPSCLSLWLPLRSRGAGNQDSFKRIVLDLPPRKNILPFRNQCCHLLYQKGIPCKKNTEINRTPCRADDGVELVSARAALHSTDCRVSFRIPSAPC